MLLGTTAGVKLARRVATAAGWSLLDVTVRLGSAVEGGATTGAALAAGVAAAAAGVDLLDAFSAFSAFSDDGLCLVLEDIVSGLGTVLWLFCVVVVVVCDRANWQRRK